MSAPAGHHPQRTIRLLEYDPDLGRGLRPERFAEAQRSATASVVELARGDWDPRALDGDQPPYGLLLLDGLLTRDLLLGDVASAQLLGRGDLIAPAVESGEELLGVGVRWTVLEPTGAALLDERFLFAVRRWPQIVAALFGRVAEQSQRIAKHRALCQLPRVEDRIHALLWFLAERWGRVTPQGVVLPLKLTHGTLGRLVGAKRPTVSLAVKQLAQHGAVQRRSDGAWLLERAWSAEPERRCAVTASAASFAWDADSVATRRTAIAPPRPAAEPARPPVAALVDVRERMAHARTAHSQVALDVSVGAPPR